MLAPVDIKIDKMGNGHPIEGYALSCEFPALIQELYCGPRFLFVAHGSLLSFWPQQPAAFGHAPPEMFNGRCVAHCQAGRCPKRRAPRIRGPRPMPDDSRREARRDPIHRRVWLERSFLRIEARADWRFCAHCGREPVLGDGRVPAAGSRASDGWRRRRQQQTVDALAAYGLHAPQAWWAAQAEREAYEQGVVQNGVSGRSGSPTTRKDEK
jgi:hypothetical protein